eukprot:gb/GEZN01010269.1/.p1 GENE.gb/GEZN01010269.1/~~gb/GEZN01010269.1/.p1  ORF type:complete len:338 (-),score=28.22 gb/GEZN01010269.1/:239-1228(-)
MAKRLYKLSSHLQDSQIPLVFPVALKMCQLDMLRFNRRLTQPPADMLFFDEFQDVNSAQLSILQLEVKNIPIVVIGDPSQSIYGFRGAVEAFDKIKHQLRFEYTYTLTRSFRFGPDIARKANIVQRMLPSEDDLEIMACFGVSKCSPSTSGNVPPLTIALLCQFNKEVILTATKLLLLDPRFSINITGHALNMLDISLKLHELNNRGVPMEYGGYVLDRWHEVEQLNQMNQGCADFELNGCITIMRESSEKTLKQQKTSLVDETKATVVICTVHQSKGREWDIVQLVNSGVDWGTQPGVWKRTQDSVNVFYVAVTRARQQLHCDQLEKK